MLQKILDWSTAAPLVSLLLILGCTSLLYAIHQLIFHPLRHIPGPILLRLTPIPLFYHVYIGDEASFVDSLHSRYGPIVRIGPSALSIAAPDAIHPIYVQHGGLLKADCYRNFDIDGHATIFSTQDPNYRAKRHKLVVSMFAMNRVREAFSNEHSKLRDRVVDFVARLQARKAAGKRWDLLVECRRLAVDVVPTHLYGRQYGALREDGLLSSRHTQEQQKAKDDQNKAQHPLDSPQTAMSAGLFVDSFVSVGRWFLLPSWLVLRIEAFVARIFPDPAAEQSMACVDAFVAALVDDAKPGDDTYQARLLDAGISPGETKAQCADLMFAGTDSTAQTLTAIIFHLLRDPALLNDLHHQLVSQQPTHRGSLNTPPLLTAVVKEGLRLGMPNPPRLPRQVGPAGLQLLGHAIPPGTTVGCASHILHHDAHVYADPFAFRPQRWLDDGHGHGSIDAAGRSLFAFGAGPRQCIARNLAMQELLAATEAVVASGVLSGLRTVGDRIEIVEWFNSCVKGKKVEVEPVGPTVV